MNTLLVVDGNALIHRAYHAYPLLTTKNGTPTNAVYGFAYLFYKAVEKFKPTHVVVCFDTPEKTFRNELFASYQENRPHADETLISQFALVREFLDQAGIIYFEKPGYEADDLIGTLSKHATPKNHILILTGDKDIFQLVNKNVSVVTPKKGMDDIAFYTPSEVKKKMGVEAQYIPDLKALMGDPSDNYPGIAGVGPKTAANLINTYGSLENIYKSKEKIQSSKLKDLLSQYEKDAFLFKKIATILTDAETSFNFDLCVFKGYKPDLKNFFQTYEIFSLIKRYFPEKETKKINNPPPKKNTQLDLFT